MTCPTELQGQTFAITGWFQRSWSVQVSKKYLKFHGSGWLGKIHTPGPTFSTEAVTMTLFHLRVRRLEMPYRQSRGTDQREGWWHIWFAGNRLTLWNTQKHQHLNEWLQHLHASVAATFTKCWHTQTPGTRSMYTSQPAPCLPLTVSFAKDTHCVTHFWSPRAFAG